MKIVTTLAVLAWGISAVPLIAQQHQHGRVAPDSASMSVMHCRVMETMGSMMTGEMIMGGMRGGQAAPMMMQGGGMGSGGWMMQAMRLSPWHVLAHEDALGLDAEQVAKIEALGSAHGMAVAMPEAQSLHRQLQQAFTATPADTAGIRTTLESLASLHARVHAGHLAAVASVRGLLTSEQRAALERLPPPCSMGQGAM